MRTHVYMHTSVHVQLHLSSDLNGRTGLHMCHIGYSSGVVLQRKTALDEHSILVQLPPKLKHSVTTFLLGERVHQVILLDKLQPSALAKFYTILSPILFAPGT